MFNSYRLSFRVNRSPYGASWYKSFGFPLGSQDHRHVIRVSRIPASIRAVSNPGVSRVRSARPYDCIMRDLFASFTLKAAVGLLQNNKT